MAQNDIVQKLWNLCDVLRDDGINYSEYVTELALLLFIKMESEQVAIREDFKHKLPEGCRWCDLNTLSGIPLLNKYKRILLTLSTGIDAEKEIDPFKENGKKKTDEEIDNERHVVKDPLIMAIYAEAQTRLREPKHLETLVSKLDKLDWFSGDKDDLGDMYEGLLEKNANETKSGAGQYFTPRVLIRSIIRLMKPAFGEVIQDPAAGTAGFLTEAHNLIKETIYDHKQDAIVKHLKNNYVGMELVPNTRRLALMNCLLHGMEGDKDGVVHLGNTLGDAGTKLPKANVILTNPPFGTAKGGGGPTRKDLIYETSNKQLAFLQHIYRSLKPGGRAAVVLPDNVLFEAGVGTDIRKDLMEKCDLHTILRLPTGIFYAAGVKTNVLFFTKGTKDNPDKDENCTKHVWVYDLRTNMPSFGKRTPFSEAHLSPFEALFGNDPYDQSGRKEGDWSFYEGEKDKTQKNSRWRVFDREYIEKEKDNSLDISWIKDKASIEAEDLQDPEELAQEAMDELSAAMNNMKELLDLLGIAK